MSCAMLQHANRGSADSSSTIQFSSNTHVLLVALAKLSKFLANAGRSSDVNVSVGTRVSAANTTQIVLTYRCLFRDRFVGEEAVSIMARAAQEPELDTSGRSGGQWTGRQKTYLLQAATFVGLCTYGHEAPL